jgi:hypothetical protein
MQFAGSAYWRFEAGRGEQMLHFALLVRDAAVLVPPPSAEIPPPLVGPVAGRGDVLSADKRIVAGRDWVDWWHRIVELRASEARSQGGPRAGGDLLTWASAMHDQSEQVFDPPDFA